MKPLVAMVGWRGMVGSVLMKRMHEEHDFDLIRAKFFSTSNAGGSAPVGDLALADASDLDPVSVPTFSTQGSISSLGIVTPLTSEDHVAGR